MQAGGEGNTNGWRLVTMIKTLYDSTWDVNFDHVYRTTNMCTEAVSNMGCARDLTMEVYNNLSPQVLHILIDYLMDVSLPPT